MLVLGVRGMEDGEGDREEKWETERDLELGLLGYKKQVTRLNIYKSLP